MKKLPIFIFIWLVLACNPDAEQFYTGNELRYNLYAGSEFSYTGELIVRETVGKELELRINLEGNKSETPYFFPAHLHFGAYDSPDAPIAYLLNPVDIRTLNSTTLLSTLSDGRNLKFEEFKQLDGHIKIHLADSGPDYQVILTAGNIGKNDNTSAAFSPSSITICASGY
jgi:hypothetical protein